MIKIQLFGSQFTDFTLSNARRFYSSKGEPLGTKGLINPLVPKGSPFDE